MYPRAWATGWSVFVVPRISYEHRLFLYAIGGLLLILGSFVAFLVPGSTGYSIGLGASGLGVVLLCAGLLSDMADSSTRGRQIAGSGLALGLFVFAMVLPAVFGYQKAKNTVLFFTMPSKPEYVIVRNYGDRLIGVKFDRAKKRVQPEIMVLKLDQVPDLRLVPEDLGPLQGAR